MRLFVSLIASAAMVLAASAAGAAVTFTATTSADLGNLNPGEEFTIDITLRSDGETAFGLGGAATGYGGVLEFVSGEAAGAALAQVCVGGSCFGGLDNSIVDVVESTDNPLGPEVQFFNGVSTGGTANTGEVDESPDGTAGAPQFRLVFRAIGGAADLTIGALEEYGDALIIAGGARGQSNNAVLAINVIPEPGTALLMGLGLAGLAAAGRRD